MAEHAVASRLWRRGWRLKEFMASSLNIIAGAGPAVVVMSLGRGKSKTRGRGGT